MKIALIGNYAPDRQESMLRYAVMLRDALTHGGFEVALAVPGAVLNRAGHDPRGVWKWCGYADKYWLGLSDIARAVRRADVVHICDHSNAVYVPRSSAVPYVVSCHDLLAVRGALGEDTDCPASAVGRHLQLAILRGLGRARALACGSQATLRDAQRLLNGYSGRLTLGCYALSYPYRLLPADQLRDRLVALPALTSRPYVLHVGSNLRRKNRQILVRAVASIAGTWNGNMVFAGQPLDAASRALAAELGIVDRVIDVPKPDGELLEGLYNGALAMLFPSRFEGFGWPIVEAQACGCPVICSDRDPLPDVAGGAAILCDSDDAQAFGQAILSFARSDRARSELVARGLANCARFSRAELIRRFSELYTQVAGHA